MQPSCVVKGRRHDVLLPAQTMSAGFARTGTDPARHTHAFDDGVGPPRCATARTALSSHGLSSWNGDEEIVALTSQSSCDTRWIELSQRLRASGAAPRRDCSKSSMDTDADAYVDAGMRAAVLSLKEMSAVELAAMDIKELNRRIRQEGLAARRRSS